jgi:hypothetical protein
MAFHRLDRVDLYKQRLFHSPLFIKPSSLFFLHPLLHPFLLLPSVDRPLPLPSIHSLNIQLVLPTTTVFSSQWFASLASLHSPLLSFLPSLVTSFDTERCLMAGKQPSLRFTHHLSMPTLSELLLQPYDVYHRRYEAFKCFEMHNTTFFDDCCHPLLVRSPVTIHHLLHSLLNVLPRKMNLLRSLKIAGASRIVRTKVHLSLIRPHIGGLRLLMIIHNLRRHLSGQVLRRRLCI